MGAAPAPGAVPERSQSRAIMAAAEYITSGRSRAAVHEGRRVRGLATKPAVRRRLSGTRDAVFERRER
ncbi:hypothetical protein A4G86_23380 [Burkholderia pseudomallei]|nr:hypothetical protein A4G86_23380 [Burkholderia pseudomallei]